MHLIKVL